MIWEFDPAIPHGAVQQLSYFSKALRKKRSLHVYTPPGYEEKRFGKYPVFFLFHGAGDNDATWTEFGRAQYILDNLIAKSKAQPMVVVMTDGHAMTQSGQGTNYFLKNVQAFEDDLLNDVLPLVEKRYRVRRDRDHRAIAGLSMGGGQSLQVGLHHQEIFSWVAGFSSFVPDPDKTIVGAIEDSDQVNKRLKLLWIACGKDDFLLNNNKALDELLTQSHIKHVFKITDGKHNWPVWRSYLAELLPQLF
jgi:enterochelin esterase family protein